MNNTEVLKRAAELLRDSVQYPPERHDPEFRYLREETEQVAAALEAMTKQAPIAVVTETNSGTKLTIFGRLHWFFSVFNSREAYTLAEGINAEFSQKIARIPDGWHLAPYEPTPEMLATVPWPATAKLDYQRMLAAAPKWEGK